MVMAWLLNALTSALANSVIYADTPAEIWSDLQDRFSLGNLTRVFQIRRIIAEHKQGQQTICQYYTKLKSLCDELGSYQSVLYCTCGALKVLRARQDEEQVIQFLMGLNDSYTAIRGQILFKKTVPSVKKAYSMIMQEEQQREVGEHTLSEVAHAMNVSNKSFKPLAPPLPATPKHKRPTLPNIPLKEAIHANLSFVPIVHGKDVKPPNCSKKPSIANQTQSTPPPAIEGFKFSAEEYAQLKSLLRDGKPRANFTGPDFEEDDWPGETS
ncbi:uncharacterized protein LOC110752866 [Prunus avium]|uniref:Uncharacterized protein LOC110752866 n=1 Tax=Prunus avium TaxID=42229 RepID=A0A6P5RWS3_PRUAV|nr:uncharacterized protein LOC110752866 [Prunus avium]